MEDRLERDHQGQLRQHRSTSRRPSWTRSRSGSSRASSPSDIQTDFLNVEQDATALYTYTVPTGQKYVDLATTPTSGGAFPGFAEVGGVPTAPGPPPSSAAPARSRRRSSSPSSRRSSRSSAASRRSRTLKALSALAALIVVAAAAAPARADGGYYTGALGPRAAGPRRRVRRPRRRRHRDRHQPRRALGDRRDDLPDRQPARLLRLRLHARADARLRQHPEPAADRDVRQGQQRHPLAGGPAVLRRRDAVRACATGRSPPPSTRRPESAGSSFPQTGGQRLHDGRPRGDHPQGRPQRRLAFPRSVRRRADASSGSRCRGSTTR